MMQKFFKRLGRLGQVTCGQALVSSVLINMVLGLVLIVTIAHWRDQDINEIEAKAAQLQHFRLEQQQRNQ